MKRKGDLMREIYGTGDGICKGCRHLLAFSAGNRCGYKCRLYGNTRSEASDWKLSEIACGARNRDVCGNRRPVIELVGPQKKPEENVPGQMSMEEFT